uniref:spexin prohormone 1-like isoform X1 n=1 Tax=Gasterosteus aculeatus aculeatus TaxID=481459 RepID=UPI001A999F2F|nr:spexin prohormone 1-like isoform X1 [Gasterosteus aculeatus aculeatus]
MVPTVTLLVVTLVAATWGEAQQRNWTPHAILYLKGARDRSVLRRTSRVEGNTLHIVTRDQSIDGPGASLSSLLLELLQRVAEKGGGNPDNYHDEQQLNLKYV